MWAGTGCAGGRQCCPQHRSGVRCPPALSAPSHWFCALWLESGEYSPGLDRLSGSSSPIANCSSRLANNLASVALKMLVEGTGRCTVLLLVSFPTIFFSDFYNCLAMKSQVLLILLCTCDNGALGNILETLKACMFCHQRTNKGWWI